MGVELVTTGVRAHYQWSPVGPGDSGDDIIGESQYWDDNNIDLATRKLSKDSF